MTDARGRSDLPTAVEMLESVLLLVTGAVVTLAAAILVIPYLLVRGIRSCRDQDAPAAAGTARPRAVAASTRLS